MVNHRSPFLLQKFKQRKDDFYKYDREEFDMR